VSLGAKPSIVSDVPYRDELIKKAAIELELIVMPRCQDTIFSNLSLYQEKGAQAFIKNSKPSP